MEQKNSRKRERLITMKLNHIHIDYSLSKILSFLYIHNIAYSVNCSDNERWVKLGFWIFYTVSSRWRYKMYLGCFFLRTLSYVVGIDFDARKIYAYYNRRINFEIDGLNKLRYGSLWCNHYIIIYRQHNFFIFT